MASMVWGHRISLHDTQDFLQSFSLLEREIFAIKHGVIT